MPKRVSGNGPLRRGETAPGRRAATCAIAGCATVALAFSLLQSSGVAVALASVRPATVTNYGSFKLSGAVSGSLVPLPTSCDASNTAADVEFSWFGKVKTLKGVSPKSIVSFELDLQGSNYGKPGTLKNSHGSPPFFTFNATSESGPPLAWQSVSGGYSTSKQGIGGMLDVVLDQADGQPGTLVVKGTWEHCRVDGNI